MIPTLKSLKNTSYSVSTKPIEPIKQVKNVIVEPIISEEVVEKKEIIIEPILVKEEKKESMWNVFNKILNLK